MANWVNIDPRTSIGGQLTTDLGYIKLDNRGSSDPGLTPSWNDLATGFYYQLMGGDISITVSASWNSTVTVDIADPFLSPNLVGVKTGVLDKGQYKLP